MLSIMNKIILVFFISLRCVLGSEKNCSSDDLLKMKTTGIFSTEGCVEFVQTTDNNSYIVWIGKLKESTDFVTVRYYFKKDKILNLIFEQEKIGESFLNFEFNGKEHKLVVTDINKDGVLDIIFRTYTVPATELYIQTFLESYKKIDNIGFLDFSSGETKYLPHLIFDDSVKVKIDDASVLGIKNKKTITEYKWNNSHYILKHF